MNRRLPSLDEALQILGSHRTRPARRPPPPAGRALKAMVRDLDARFGQGAGALAARWREVVGAEIARRTEPIRVIAARGSTTATLEIRVAGPSAALIQHQAQDILARVNVFLGAGAVGRLRIIQGPLRRADTAKPVRRSARPLDAAQEARLAAGLSDLPEGGLKDALAALGRGVLARDERN
ncbi:MAG: DUF721 domain-containing protein [Phenylobacterium sp.]|jgi:hypothetical protein